MSTPAQIKANQQNAQLSSGPVTETGLQASSKNATKHGFTGQTLVITLEEKQAYDDHVASYMAHHSPADHMHRQLVQQLADAHWSLHQIFVQQTNTMSLMSAITQQLSGNNDPLATAAALAPLNRSLNTLSTYEVRRRRAARQIQEELAAFEQQLAEQRAAAARKELEKKRQPAIGSVCSSSGPSYSETLFRDMLAAGHPGISPAELEEMVKDAGF